MLRNCFLLMLSVTLLLSGCAQMRASKGWSYLDKDMPDEAIREFELSKQVEVLPGYYLGMSRAHITKDDPDKVEEFLIEGIQEFPEDFFLNYDLGRLYVYKAPDKERIEKGIEILRKCRTLDNGKQFINEIDEIIAEGYARLK